MHGADPMPRPARGDSAAPCARGDRGPQVRTVQAYLRRFGYLPNPDLARAYPWWRPAVGVEPGEDDVFDEAVETAVRLLQRVYGLDETGEVDAGTTQLMGRPRCGFPDVVTSAGLAPYVAQGNRWPGPEVSYRHVNFTPDLTEQQVRDAVRGAYDRWSAHVPLTFVEAPAADMEIGFFVGDHGDGAANAFDGPGGVLAHCYYPPPNSGSAAGDCHFDEAETWSVDTPASGTDLPSVALHELGHGLGLAHSDVVDAVMYAYYDGARRELHPDDVAGIQSVYGPRSGLAPLAGALVEAAAGRRADGRVEVVGQGADGALWRVARARTPGASATGDVPTSRGPARVWGPWESWGGWLAQPCVSHAADGRLEVFGRGSDGALWQVREAGPGEAGAEWSSLGGVVSSPAVAEDVDGRRHVFVQGRDGALWHVEEQEPGGAWTPWASLGGWVTAPVVGRHADGRLEVFARGVDDAVWHVWQTEPGGAWSAWATLGGRVREVAVGSNADGRLDVFARGVDDGLWHLWQTEPNGGWSGWRRLGDGVAGRPLPVRSADGRLEVVVRGRDGGLLHACQVAPGGPWG